MNWEPVFYELVTAEQEDEVTRILAERDLDADTMWRSLGDMENNFSIVANQQADPTGALVEKVTNAIDAVLMAEAFKHNIDPEGKQAPVSMSAAVEQFLGIRDGRLENITPTERTKLADRIQLIAVGSKDEPSYLIADCGEGQTPATFPATFLSLGRSNKMRIPFVQGRFNAGGTGVMQLCGKENYQLIASKRAPEAPRAPDDRTGDDWGFTLIRRLLPADGRKNSMYVYLAPGGTVPTFRADAIKVLPGESSAGNAPRAYCADLPFGTVVKLYNYSWKARSIATTEARFELERILHAPCLPFRIVETRRAFKAHYFATTVSGVWVRVRGESGGKSASDVEDDFPAYGQVKVANVGTLPWTIAVFRDDVDSRRIPTGVFFTLNGQSQGSLPRDFIAREAKLDYIAKDTLVSIDCTRMDERVREDFFMASRDRLRRNEVYQAIAADIRAILSGHAGLKELNARRRARRFQKKLENETESREAFQDLIRSDPALASLFSVGERLVTSLGPAGIRAPYRGRRFPSFFRIAKEPSSGLIKSCPRNWKCRVEFETDAENDYFDRPDSPGRISVRPDEGIMESRTLFNGECVTYFRPPSTAKAGDVIAVEVAVTDDQRDISGGPLVSEFKVRVLEDKEHERGGAESNGPRTKGPGKHTAPTLAMPTIIEVRKEQWREHEMNRYDAVKIKSSGEQEDGHDFYVNMDNTFLLTEVQRDKPTERPILEYWFKYGIALAALSMLKVPKLEDVEQMPAASTIEVMAAGLARVVIPIVRRLGNGPQTS